MYEEGEGTIEGGMRVVLLLGEAGARQAGRTEAKTHHHHEGRA